MATLTKVQRNFLEAHSISLGSVFDATGMGRKEYHDEMEALGKIVAIGVTPCARGGHSMRTRSGACVFCNPSAVVFQERWTQSAFVYVAGSLALRVIKVGMASCAQNRILGLNSLSYAGASDWVLLYYIEVKNAGLQEFKAHKILSKYASPRIYIRDGRQVDCLETFACDVERAIDAIKKNISSICQEWKNKKLLNDYNFEAITGGSFVRKAGDRLIKSAKPIERSSPSKGVSVQSDEIKPEETIMSELNSSKDNISLIQSAERGDGEAQYILGEIYLDGIDSDGIEVKRDYEKALKWCSLAAHNHHAAAQYQLALMYMEGKGVLKNLNEAYAWATVAFVGNDKKAVHLKERLEALLRKADKLTEAIIRTAEIMKLIQGKQSENVIKENRGYNDRVNSSESFVALYHSLTAACPTCGGLNRIRVSDVNRRPLCGHSGCRSSLVVESTKK